MTRRSRCTSPCRSGIAFRKLAHGRKPEGHDFERDKTMPRWHGWHAFRRGLATNLHGLGVDDKTIQAILRHSNIGITQNIYIKSVSEQQLDAMDSLSEKLGICNDHATNEMGRIQWLPQVCVL
jgi:integrase